MNNRLIIHGRDHLPNGSDPIPFPTFPRIVYGRIYNDGDIQWEGSGDWSSDITDGWITVTIDPPFTVGYATTITPSDNGDTFSVPPPLINLSGLSESGFVQAIQVDLGTFRIMFWDLDGNPFFSNRCGFNFEAVGT